MLDTCDIVVDVGGIFDPAKHRYDHHQRFVKCLTNEKASPFRLVKPQSAKVINNEPFITCMMQCFSG